VIRRALARPPEERFEDAGTFAAALRASLEAAEMSPVDRANLRFDTATLDRAEQDLAAYVGPLARVLVRQAAAVPGNRLQLYDRLAVHIISEADRTIFRRKALLAGPGPGPAAPEAAAGPGGNNRVARRHAAAPAPSDREDGSAPPTLTEAENAELIEKAVRDLTEYIGPLARITVRRTVPTVATAEALYRSLAEHIPNERQRAAFLKRMPEP
jgi:serine/threonine-protein kinase